MRYRAPLASVSKHHYLACIDGVNKRLQGDTSLTARNPLLHNRLQGDSSLIARDPLLQPDHWHACRGMVSSNRTPACGSFSTTTGKEAGSQSVL